MSLNMNGISCSHCKAYFFSEDDVVYCPICGAPHHRECYNSLGHCALEELHGTDKQYSRAAVLEAMKEAEEKKEEKREKENIAENTKCMRCGEVYSYSEPACPNCGTPNFAGANGMPFFDLLGGVSPQKEIAEGITADDAKNFVLTNTHRYIPKFAKFKKGKKISWNWLAFFLPSCWMLSRKMYKGGIITTILLIITELLMYPLSLAILNSNVSQMTDPMVMVQTVLSSIPENKEIIIIAFYGALLIQFIIRLISALLGDYWYRNYTVNSIKKIRKEKQDTTVAYRKKGGVSVPLFFMGYLLLQNLPILLLSFI